MLANKADLGYTALTAIFPPWGTVDLDGVGRYSFKYTSRLEGDGSIQARIKNDFPEASASSMIRFRQLFPADLDYDEYPMGKNLVEWKAPNSPCVDSAGIDTLNLFAETNWYLQVYVNDHEKVNVSGNSRGQSPRSLEADSDLDDGTGASA